MMIVRLCIMISYLSNVMTLKPRFYFDRKPFLFCRSLLWQSVLKLLIPITMSYWCFTAFKIKADGTAESLGIFTVPFIIKQRKNKIS